ncbi:hypothetical protein EST38_g7421 [Candolleomyces aberdarensis]|uniref:Uncharacterized protein n=1 Tax=Candolleomyces aberdarensis TaxID=2316362 RepID=A0A4V1Q3F7_9AGAR|nr:hypothetical protein EST38_g7421 [Candolleomyces aberdarensis]
MNSPQLQPVYLIGREMPNFPSQVDGVEYNLQGLNLKELRQFAGSCESTTIRRPPELTFQELFELDPRNVDLQDGLGQHPRDDLLQELATHVLQGYRCLIDYLAECGASVEEEPVVDNTIYQAADLLAEAGEAYDLDLDRATAIIDRVSNHAYPPWPSRAIASLILMSYGLLLRGVGQFIDLFEFNASSPKFDPENLYKLWYDVIGCELNSFLQIHCKRARDSPFDTPVLTLRKAALLLSTLTDQELDTATAVIASLGQFNMPSDEIARAALSRARRRLSAELVYKDRDPEVESQRLLISTSITLATMSAAKETLDIDRPDTLLLIGSTSNQVFKEEDGGTAFNLSKVNFALDQLMHSEYGGSLDGNSISSDRL